MNPRASGSPFLLGWHQAARRVQSPNQDQRAAEAKIDMIVVHAISLPPGDFGGPCIDALFTNTLDPAHHPALAGLDTLRVSAHFLIDRAGALTQYVPLEARAWHAGVSSFGGVTACNHRSIGIELEGTDDVPFTEAQYHSLEALCAALMLEYPDITLARIVGHVDIAPGRKTDPGPCFDWIRLRAGVRARRVSASSEG
jgi:AmpD protein